MQFGKPSKATYEFAEQVLRTQIELLYGSIKKLPNMYAIWNTIFTYTHCHFHGRYMVGGKLIKILFCANIC